MQRNRFTHPLVRVAAFSLVCMSSTVSAAHAARAVKYAAQSGELESLLLREDEEGGGEKLTGLTRLADGTRLWEEAHFDRAGKLVRAETVYTYSSGLSLTVSFEPNAGVVETRSAAGFHRWSVPNDYAWVWVSRGAITTPVATLVAARAAKQHGVLQLIDTRTFTSHTIAVDQVVVPEDARAAWVVLGDDAMLVRDGMPVRWHANALALDIEKR